MDSLVEHLGYFYFLTVVESAAVYTHVQVFLWTHVSISVSHMPRSGTSGSFDKTLCLIV